MCRNAVFYAVLTSLFFVFIEICSYLMAALYLNDYDPSGFEKHFSTSSYEKYLQTRHPITGWPRPEIYGKNIGSKYYLDETGARVSAEFPMPGNACASIYGDSFAASSGVDDAHAWSDVMARRLGCRVASYGYGGFGTDQAYLRYLHNKDEAKTIILSHMSGDIIRNINQWRAFVPGAIDYSGWRQIKPRYVLNDSLSLKLIPLPEFSSQEMQDAFTRPYEYFPHDWFAAGNQGGVALARFPFTLSILKIIKESIHAPKRFGKGYFAQFYRKDHPSDAYEVTKRILVKFAETAHERGKTPLIVFIPQKEELLNYYETGEWFSEEMAREVAEESGAPVLEFGKYIVKKYNKSKVCGIFEQRGCNGHFNNIGYELLGETVTSAVLTLE